MKAIWEDVLAAIVLSGFMVMVLAWSAIAETLLRG